MTMTYDTTYDTYGKPMLTAAQYADAAGVSERTVKRWLSADELPGAMQDPSGRWMIPADAERAPTSPGTVQMLRDTTTRDVGTTLDILAADPSIDGLISRLPAFVPVAGEAFAGLTLAQLLGIPETAIRRQRDYFQLQPFGPHGALVMPRHRIKEILG